MQYAFIYLRLDLGGRDQICSNTTLPEYVIDVMWSVIVSLEALSKIRCFAIESRASAVILFILAASQIFDIFQHLKCRV